MNAFTKEQVQKLTPEAQEALGHQLIERILHRDQLLEKMKRHSSQTWWDGMTPWVLGLWTSVFVFSQAWGRDTFSWPMIAYLSGLAVIIVIIDSINSVRATRTDRRLDALIELLEANGQLSEPVSDPASANPKPAATPAPG